ncbi:MAG: ribosome-associated translation inhibitor RaiA [Kofleriaceae bacterium]|nr:ribosome-associated translation inhibitor RaiA [Myxococcales bacterium]MCB9558780.1 ribosome-associated translation inhibitor RaiA [Kofleriaceae bacterium]MCB9570666.1 ribosome-associated translation inhibitor RaiA [Kofleriaceae bacterium]
MEPTDSLKAYARDRMERIRKYLPDPISCHVVMSTERHNHRIEVNFQLHNGLSIAGHETTENMYSSIDLCIAKIERQVRKYKGKLEERRTRPHGVEPLPWSHSIVKEAFHGVDDHHGHNGEAVHVEGMPPDFKVVRTEKFHANPMSVSDAIVQLNLLHENFLVFRNEGDETVAVVYRREDGSYGLIETGAGN